MSRDHIEHVALCIEVLFGALLHIRMNYFGRAKTHAQLAMAAIGQNLLKAANKITINPQTPAIA